MQISSGKDILINARQESVQMGHYYLGVEHLVIAMLQIEGGITASIIDDYGLAPSYVIDAIRRKTIKGPSQRLWEGFPYTPRTEVILDIAKDLVAEIGSEEITERELLVAILNESDSLPIRVFRTLGININAMTLAAVGYNLKQDPQSPDISIFFAETFAQESLQREHLFVLRRMFNAHYGVRVERQLTGYDGALVLVVTPVQVDGQEGTPVVVKIQEIDKILSEVQRYEAHVKSNVLPHMAQLEETPVTPQASDLAGIKYALVPNSEGIPLDLRHKVRTSGAYELAHMIERELYTRLKMALWQQKHPFRFQVWNEYEWLLPPLMTLDFVPEDEVIDIQLNLKVPVDRARLKMRLHELDFGNDVLLENFTVQLVDRQQNILKLAAGFGYGADQHSFPVEVRGVNDIQRIFHRGEVVERLTGTIWKTRYDHLLDAIRELEPDFDYGDPWVIVGDQQFPNPLSVYSDLLDRYINGSMSKIHGNMHLGNILVTNNSIWLIDFGSIRDGHTLFDWATLEVSILCEVLSDGEGADWNQLYSFVTALTALNDIGTGRAVSDQMFAVLAAVARVREVVRECLTVANNWDEYYVALALCGLRAISWRTMSLQGRRLAFLISALAMRELLRHKSNLAELEPIDTADHLLTIKHGSGQENE